MTTAEVRLKRILLMMHLREQIEVIIVMLVNSFFQ